MFKKKFLKILNMFDTHHVKDPYYKDLPLFYFSSEHNHNSISSQQNRLLFSAKLWTLLNQNKL